MKAFYGLLLVGVSALALGGCSTSGGGGPAALANALLGSGALNQDGTVKSTSNAGTDQKTIATGTYNDDGNDGPSRDDTVTLAVANGGQVGPSRVYGVNPANDLGDTPEQGVLLDPENVHYANFGVFKPADENDPQGAILIATTDGNAFAGFVGANGNDGTGNIAAGYGAIVAPDPAHMPGDTQPVHYSGDVAASAQKIGAPAEFISGEAAVDANFVTGDVTGTFTFDHNVHNSYWDNNGQHDIDAFKTVSAQTPLVVGFTGGMSTDKANYASSSITVDSAAGTGNVIGGFAGTGYTTTAGAIDVQDATDTPTKIIGSYIATSEK